MAEKWSSDLHPYKGTIKGDRLYGRGAADDGYASFYTLLMIKAMQEVGMSYENLLLMIETNEESDCQDIEFYLDKFKELIGEPKKVICLDSGTCDYSMPQLTTTQRGGLTFEIESKLEHKDLYWGDFHGFAQDGFFELRESLDLVCCINGRVHEYFQVEIPADKNQQMIKYLEHYDQ